MFTDDSLFTCATEPITTEVVSSNSARCEVYSIQHYVVKFVSDLQQVLENKNQIRWKI
jgi:hypothetical protein